MPDDGTPGPGIDAHGHRVIDPTKNVIDHVEAAVKRLDDLRLADKQRQDDLRDAADRHVREIGRASCRERVYGTV